MIASCSDIVQLYRIVNSLLAVLSGYSEMFSGDIWHLQGFLTAFSDDINKLVTVYGVLWKLSDFFIVHSVVFQDRL